MAIFLTSQPDSAADPLLPHLVLVGLPGAGKSTVGQCLAERLGRAFLDFDTELTRRHGMSVPEIFGRRGEEHFRALEHALTVEVREHGNMVLSPGGGWITRPDNVSLLRPPSRLVYLRVTPAVAVRRMGAGVVGRPLLDCADPAGELQRLLAVRGAAYGTADLVVDVDHIDPQEVTECILGQI